MAAERPSYMFPSHWEFPPEGRIILGSLIKDPKRAERHLYSGTVDPSLITTVSRDDFAFSTGDARSGKLGLWASFLAPIVGVSGDVAGKASYDYNRTFHFDRVVTKYFVPDDTFIAQILCNSTVKSYIENQWWATVYLVTGIKIAEGATMETTIKHGHGIESKVGADGTPAGIPVGGGPEAAYERNQSTVVKLGARDGFVLAYQLLKLKPKGEGQAKEEVFDKFALLADDEDLDAQEKVRVAQQLHETWQIGELKLPTEDEQGIELVTTDVTRPNDLDFNILVPEVPSDAQR